MKLTAEKARELLDYDPETGQVTWKHRDRSLFKSDRDYNRWNNRYAGKPAGSYNGPGYAITKIFGSPYRISRLIWLLQTGEWPKGTIDHVNGVRSDNRWKNLEDKSHRKNCQNRKIPTTNNSGRVGVCWLPGKRKWSAYIGARPKIHLGYFDNREDAIAAREQAEIAHGYHPNHGRSVT